MDHHKFRVDAAFDHNVLSPLINHFKSIKTIKGSNRIIGIICGQFKLIQNKIAMYGILDYGIYKFDEIGF